MKYVETGRKRQLRTLVKRFIGGRDIAQVDRRLNAIDTFGLTEVALRQKFPNVYQHILDSVKPVRDANRDKSIREKWWLHSRSRGDIRAALEGLTKAILTPRTAKHLYFVLAKEGFLAESEIIIFALKDVEHFAILSSKVHVIWSLAAGIRLGVGNDPRHANSFAQDNPQRADFTHGSF